MVMSMPIIVQGHAWVTFGGSAGLGLKDVLNGCAFG